MRSFDRARLAWAGIVPLLLLPPLLLSCSGSEDESRSKPPPASSATAASPAKTAPAAAEKAPAPPPSSDLASQDQESSDEKALAEGQDELAEDEAGQTFEDVVETHTVTVRETSLGKITEGFLEKSSVVSADGLSVCWASLHGDDSGVYLNGQRVGGPFKLLGTTGLVISPDGKHVAYTVNSGTGIAIRLDDQEFDKGYTGVSSTGLSFSPDSQHFGFVAARGTGQLATIDGAEGPVYDGIRAEGIDFSSNGRHSAYIATKGEDWFVVVDGAQSSPWKAIGEQGVLFSADGEHVAYAARRAKTAAPAEGEAADEWVVVHDGKEGSSYKSAGQLTFAPAGSRFAYNAEVAKNQWVVVVDGVASEPAEDVHSHPSFSPDGKRVAYSVARGQELFVVIDGVEGPAYDRMSKKGKRTILFDPSGQNYVYVGKKGDERILVVNGEEVARHESLFQRTLRFLPGSTDLAYVANNPQSSYLVFGDQQSKPYTRLIDDSDIVSDDGQHWSFAVRDGRQQFYVVDGVEGDRYAFLYPGLAGFVGDSRDFVHVGRRGKDSYPIVHAWGRGPAYEEVPTGSKLLLTAEGTARFIARRNDEYFFVEVLPREGR